jgi:hypothetical protein
MKNFKIKLSIFLMVSTFSLSTFAMDPISASNWYADKIICEVIQKGINKGNFELSHHVHSEIALHKKKNIIIPNTDKVITTQLDLDPWNNTWEFRASLVDLTNKLVVKSAEIRSTDSDTVLNPSRLNFTHMEKNVFTQLKCRLVYRN